MVFFDLRKLSLVERFPFGDFQAVLVEGSGSIPLLLVYLFLLIPFHHIERHAVVGHAAPLLDFQRLVLLLLLFNKLVHQWHCLQLFLLNIRGLRLPFCCRGGTSAFGFKR